VAVEPTTADLEALLEGAVQSDPSPAVVPARPPVLDGLANVRYSIALSNPADATLRHIPYTSLHFEQQSGEVATRVSASIPDVESNLGPLWELCRMGTPLWLLGGQERLVEMFQGTILEVGERSTNSGSFGVVAYDGLYNALKSKLPNDTTFGPNSSVSEIMTSIASSVNVPLGFVEEPGIKLGPLVLRSDKSIIDHLTDILKQVNVRGGGALKLRVMQGKLELVRPASNPVIYHFRTGGVAVQTTIKGSIADMVNAVVVKGHASDDEDSPILRTARSEAGFTGATEVIVAADADSEQTTQLEADSILADKGFPRWTYSHTSFAVPGIYKWERVHITDGIVDDHFIVAGVSMDLVARTMTMDLLTTEQMARETRQIQLQTALDELKGTQHTSTAASHTNGASRILEVANPVMGLAYVWGGAGGRSDFSKDMHHVGTDCSGFVSWVTRQLGGTTGTTTDAIAQQSKLIATNSLEGAAPGDYILYWDGGAEQKGMAYPHAAMYLGNGEVIESGGSTSPSSIGKGHLLTRYPRYEVRRNDTVYNNLNATQSKAAGSPLVKVA
jgi:hypothetical protein